MFNLCFLSTSSKTHLVHNEYVFAFERAPSFLVSVVIVDGIAVSDLRNVFFEARFVTRVAGVEAEGVEPKGVADRDRCGCLADPRYTYSKIRKENEAESLAGVTSDQNCVFVIFVPRVPRQQPRLELLDRRLVPYNVHARLRPVLLRPQIRNGLKGGPISLPKTEAKFSVPLLSWLSSKAQMSWKKKKKARSGHSAGRSGS